MAGVIITEISGRMYVDAGLTIPDIRVYNRITTDYYHIGYTSTGIVVSGDIIPDKFTNDTIAMNNDGLFNLGSDECRFDELYLRTSTLHLGNGELNISDLGIITISTANGLYELGQVGAQGAAGEQDL